MKTISLAAAFTILDDADAIVVENFITDIGLSDLNGESENLFLALSWRDDDGADYIVKFCEGQNSVVKVNGSDLFLVDCDGDEVQITVLAPIDVESPNAEMSEDTQVILEFNGFNICIALALALYGGAMYMRGAQSDSSLMFWACMVGLPVLWVILAADKVQRLK
jgi:hypothetical protein